MHAELREAGPVVHLSRYDVYAMARYEQVHAALVDWQELPVGGRRGPVELPLREAVAPAEPAARGRPAAARRPAPGAAEDPRPAGAAPAARAAGSPTPSDLVDEVAGRRRLSSTPSRRWPQAFPLRVFPDAVGIPQEGRENLLPYGDHAFNAFGPANDLVAQGAPRVAELSAWVERPVRRATCWRRPGSARDIWAASDRGDITPEQAPLIVRSLLTRGRRHDRARHLRRPLRASPPTPTSGSGCASEPSLARVAFDEAVRWESPVQTFFRTATTDVRVGDHVVPEGKKILMFLGAANRDPRRWARPRRLRPVPRPVRPRRVRHGHPPVRRPARRPPRGRGAAHRAGPPGPHIELAGPVRRTTTTPCGPGRASPSA